MTEIGYIHMLYKGYTMEDRAELAKMGKAINSRLTMEFLMGDYDICMLPYKERTKEYVYDCFKQLLEAASQAEEGVSND